MGEQPRHLEPKSKLLLFYGVTRELIARRAIDGEIIETHVTGFDELREAVEGFTVEECVRLAGFCPLASSAW